MAFFSNQGVTREVFIAQFAALRKSVVDYAASLPERYAESRKEKVRYMYSGTALAHFVEIAETRGGSSKRDTSC